jgi:hypothetical protein
MRFRSVVQASGDEHLGQRKPSGHRSFTRNDRQVLGAELPLKLKQRRGIGVGHRRILSIVAT